MTLVSIDIEADLVRLTAAAFPGYIVATEVPSGPVTERLITFVATGGPQLNPHVDQAHVNVFVFHPDPEAVQGEALKVQAFLNELRTPFIREASASYPSRSGSSSDETSPRRYMYADLRLRKDVR